ncbi:MAG: hypothetical protein WCH46_00975 [bacterium]
MKSIVLYTALFVGLLSGIAASQTPVGTIKTSKPSDSAMIFVSPRPLLEDNASAAHLDNMYGIAGQINDYGFGLGIFYRRVLSEDLSASVNIDVGTAKGSKEFGFIDVIKINRINVIPVMLSLQYRILNNSLGDGLRPYLTAGAGPTIITTTDASQDFFTALKSPQFFTTFGGFLGFGAYFGIDPRSNFGASLKYFFIPYHSPGIESTQGVFLTDFSGPALVLTYGFNF